MQAEYEVYRKMTIRNREMVIILPGTRWASTVMPAVRLVIKGSQLHVHSSYSGNNISPLI